MAEIILDIPEITNQSSIDELTFEISGNKLISDICELSIKVTFEGVDEMDCGIRVAIDRTRHGHLTIDPNTINSTKYDIYRYYGKVATNKIGSFKFRLKSLKSFKNATELQQLKADMAIASPVPIIVTVYDCSSPNIKKSDSIIFKLIAP